MQITDRGPCDSVIEGGGAPMMIIEITPKISQNSPYLMSKEGEELKKIVLISDNKRIKCTDL